MDNKCQRPFILSLGNIPHNSDRHHSEEYCSCRYNCGVPIANSHTVLATLPDSVCSGPLYRPFLPPSARIWTGPRAEKHGFCHLDSIYLPQSSFFGRSWLLYPMAEYRQQHRIMASRQAELTAQVLMPLIIIRFC